MTTFLVLAYGFVTTFILSSLSRNRREERADAPILTYAGHGLLAASATAAALSLAVAALAALGLSLSIFGVALG